MMSQPRRPRPILRLLLVGGGIWWLLATLVLWLQGVTLLFYLYVIVAVVQLESDLRARRAGSVAAAEDVPDLDRPTQGRAAGRRRLRAVTASLLWALFFGALFATSSMAPRLGRLPLFAGAAMVVLHTGFSDTVDVSVAEPDERFLVVDVEIRPRLLADLGYLSHRDFRLRLDDGTFVPADRASFAIPNGCEGPMPRSGTRVCSLVFSLPADADGGAVRYRDGFYGGGTARFEFVEEQASVPRIEIYAVATARLLGHPSGYGRAPEGRRYLYAALRLEPQGVEEPIGEFFIKLLAPGVEAYDRSRSTRLARPCGEVVIEGTTYCTAVFEVPEGLQNARVTVVRYGFRAPSKIGLAGVTEVSF